MKLAERWARFSVKEQIGHVASEIGRARIWEERGDERSRREALRRVLELIDMSIDQRRTSVREWARLRELVCNCLARAGAYRVTLKDLERFGLRHFTAGAET